MSAEPSPASTSSTSNGNSLSSPQSRNGPEPRLVIRKQPPTHVFSDEWFNIEVGLEGSKGSPEVRVETECVATLHNLESQQLVRDPSALTVDPESIHLSTVSSPSERPQSFRCKLNSEKLPLSETSSVAICISTRHERDARGVIPVTTRRINLVNLKLKIKEEEEEEWESVWYKDEGGRDKCMTAKVGLYNKNDELQVGKKVPLQLTLCYGNNDEPIRVNNQDIFRVVGTSRHHIDKKSGTATLRFRIEDVSKNHQGQEFRVEVAPEPKASAFSDIALTYTPNVSIRSKRNKRQRLATGKTDTRGPSPVGGRPPFQGRSSSYLGDEGHESSLAASSDVSRVREAMKGVISWTDDVVNGLYPLQWQIIGYAQNPDGTPDYNRPYHSMPNPNVTISRILSTYSDATRENLRVLLTAVEKSSPGTRADSPFLLAGAGVSGDRFGTMEGAPPAMMTPGLHGAYGAGAYHPVGALEGFRDKRETDLSYQAAQGVAMRQPQPMYPQTGMRSRQPASLHAQEGSLPSHLRQGKSTGLERDQQRLQPIPVHEQRTQRPYDEESREGEVEYVLAKQFKALRTGERLGFPAYSTSKELLGFYRESSMKVGVGQFVPISMHRDDFGHMEILHATEILDEAITSKSEAVHSLKDWGSITSLVDHALVYDWTKEIGGNNNSS